MKKCMKILKSEVNRVVYRTVTSASAIPFTVKKQNSLMVGKGNTKISIAGKEGVRTTVSKEKVVDGRVVESEILEEKVTSNPITQLLLVGTGSEESAFYSYTAKQA